jgi:hypothetical protein
MLAFEDGLNCVNDQTAARREALGAVWATAVLHHGRLVIHCQVRGLCQRHLMSVYLKQENSMKYSVENFPEKGLGLLYSGI